MWKDRHTDRRTNAQRTTDNVMMTPASGGGILKVKTD